MVVPRAVNIEFIERFHEVPNRHIRGVVVDETVWFRDRLLIDDDGCFMYGWSIDIGKRG